MRSAHRLPLLGLFLGTLALPALGRADQTAADLLPASTVGYIEVADPGSFVDLVLEHPLRAKLEAMEDFGKQLKSDQFRQFQAALAFIELQIGMDWKEAVSTLTAGGLFFAFDAETQGVVLMLKAGDEEKLTKVKDTLIDLVSKDADKKGYEFETKEYRGLTAYKANEAVYAQLGTWFCISNKGDLLKSVADSFLDGGDGTLASNENFAAAHEQAPDNATAWSFFNVQAVREAGIAKELFRDKNDNPPGELLLGGVLSTLAKTPYASLTLQAENECLKLSASVPHDSSWTPPQREFFFGEDGGGKAPQPFVPQELLLSMESFRDVGKFWLAKEDLFDDKTLAGFAQVDTQFTTLFSGLDLGQDVLSALAPQSQFLLVRQAFDETGELPTPDIKLPAGAYIYKLNDPTKLRRRFKIAFQSFVGFINVISAQQGQPALELNTEKQGEASIISASYIPEDAEEGEGLINYNFSPAIAFSGDYFIISSTAKLARELADLSGKGAPDSAEENTRLGLDLETLSRVLEDNRTQLVAQNALQKGHSKEAAEKEIGTLLELLKVGRESTLRLVGGQDSIKLELELKLAP